MAISHTLSFSVATSSGTVSQSQSVSSDGEINSDFSATGSATTEVHDGVAEVDFHSQRWGIDAEDKLFRRSRRHD